MHPSPHTPLQRIMRTGLACLLILIGLSVWATTVAYAQGPCFTEFTGDNTTDFDSSDAQAVQDAVAAAPAGGTVKVAGYCAGVTLTNGISQTAYITKSLTMQGGYTSTDWTVSDPDTQPTTLDADRLGRVAVISGTIEVTLDGLILTGGGNIQAVPGFQDDGAGLWTNSVVTLTHSSVISNEIVTEDDGAGIYVTEGRLTIADSEIAENINAADDSGGLDIDNSQVTLLRTLVRDNATLNGSSNGGGMVVRNGSQVEIIDSTLRGNYTQGNSANGGAIYSNNSLNVISITNTLFEANETQGASANGGAINAFTGTLTIVDSRFEDNHTRGSSATGGAISNSDATISLVNTHILSNTTADAIGGGLYIGGGSYTISSSTIAYNRSLDPDRAGGGLAFNQFGDNQKFVTLENVTMSHNEAAGDGGAIWVPRGFLTMTHVSLSDNTAAITRTGGISVTINGSVTMASSLIANSTGADCQSTSSFTDGGYNLVEDGACITAGTSLSGDPNLGPLADNAGSTQTHALLAGSDAIDAIFVGDNGCGTTITTDQRGIARPQNSSCDIGAFELEATGLVACFVSLNNSNTTDYSSGDASAVQMAVNAANAGDLLKVAGTCRGVTLTNSIRQTAYITKSLTMQGGYTSTDWTVSDPDTQPTTLDADRLGRVAVISGTI
ncbi:MAG TPA: choice-of-anchor Q domain-containing protein, partial [Anaerolineae bacterium]